MGGNFGIVLMFINLEVINLEIIMVVEYLCKW